MDFVNWVLVPIDFSEDSKEALKVADQQAAHWGSGIILLHIKPIPQGKARLTMATDALEKWFKFIHRTPKNQVVCLTYFGDPVKEILAVAEQYRVRKIIMGRGGDACQPGHIAQAVGRYHPGIVDVVSQKYEESISEHIQGETHAA